MIDKAYSAEVNRTPLLTKKEKEELDYILSNGSTDEQKIEARQKLVLSCLRTAIEIAGRYKGMYPQVEYDEILGLCNFALVKAGKYYNPEKAANFKTYATKAMQGNVWYELGKQSALGKKLPVIVDSYLEEDGLTLRETAENPNAENPLEILEQNDLENLLYLSMKDFDERKRTIAILRAQGFTQEETSRVIGISRERTRQIEVSLIETLRKRMQHRTA